MVERVQTRNMTRERKRKVSSSPEKSQCSSEPKVKKARFPPPEQTSVIDDSRRDGGETASNGVNGTHETAKQNQSTDRTKQSSTRGSTSRRERRQVAPSQDSGTNNHQRSEDRKDHRKDRRRRSDSSGTVRGKQAAKDENQDVKRLQDDREGHLVVNKGDVIQARYKCLQKLGEGAFGKVVHCHDMEKDMKVALKIIKNVSKYRDAARLEINVLKKIGRRDPDGRSLCVRMFDWFDFHGHVCISFEVLGLSVFDYLKDNNYDPYHFEEVREISYQLCHAVAFLHDMKLTHTDLKPENILFVNADFDMVPSSTGKLRRKLKDRRIRLIDFGSATFDHEHRSRVVCTRHYRAPEVILDLGWSQKCDIWSIGCIMFELYTGNTLFQTHDNIEHLRMMEKTLGKLPWEMIRRTPKTYFNGDVLMCCRKILQYVDEHCCSLKKYRKSDCHHHVDLFHLLKKLLEYDPKYRICAAKAMKHPYFDRARKKFEQTN